MSRKIHCSRCKKYVGEIRDAKLIKDLSHTCKSCQQDLVALELAYKYQQDKKGEDLFGGDDIFGDTFGDIFGKSKWKK